jgi:predicted dehydrogenase
VNVAIVGAGSIGNHLAYSARKKRWSISVFDNDPLALKRFRNEIYPSRYENFDSGISLLDFTEFPSKKGIFDCIFIGTPPDSHLSVLEEAVRLEPKIVLVEKPLSIPSIEVIEKMRDIFNAHKEIVFLCGYNHRLSVITQTLLNSLSGRKANVKSLDVRWRESWDGILRAHPWISHPGETYLGSTSRGGGALFEHSHGLDLWWILAKELKLGIPRSLKAITKRISDDSLGLDYDSETKVVITTNKDFKGTVVQDVVSIPALKNIEVQTDEYQFSSFFGKDGEDCLDVTPMGAGIGGFKMRVNKPRPSDFDPEIEFIENLFHGTVAKPDLGLNGLSGLFTSFLGALAVDSYTRGEEVRVPLDGWEAILQNE